MSKLSNTNLSLFLLGITNKPDVVIIDEADYSEEFIRLMNSITLKFELNSDFNIALEQLNKYNEELKDEVQTLKNKESSNVKEIRKIESLMDSISFLDSDYKSHKEPWVISKYKTKKGEIRSKVEPVTCDRFLEPLIEKMIVIKMSATLQPEPGYEYFESPSPFPKEIRQWKYEPLGRMSLKYREKTIPKLAYFLSNLKGKTLVHCNSYRVAENTAYALRRLNKYPLLQTVDGDEMLDQETVSRYDAVNAFKSAIDPNKILLSVNLNRGVDFPESNIINNVIAVVPFPNPTEPLTVAKNNLLGKDWQNKKIAQTITQSYGRVNRNADKITITYIVDSNFGWWFRDNKKLFPNFFLEAQLP